MYNEIEFIFPDFRNFNTRDKVTKMECVIILCHVINVVIHEKKKKEIAQKNVVLNSDIARKFNVKTTAMYGALIFFFCKSDLKLEIDVFLLRSQRQIFKTFTVS